MNRVVTEDSSTRRLSLLKTGIILFNFRLHRKWRPHEVLGFMPNPEYRYNVLKMTLKNDTDLYNNSCYYLNLLFLIGMKF